MSLNKPCFATPSIDFDRRLLFIGCCDCSMYCITLDGEIVSAKQNLNFNIFKEKIFFSQKWVFKTQEPIFCTAALFGDRIIFGSYDHNLYCVQKDTAALIWTVDFGAQIYATPFVINFGSDFKFVISANCDGKF